MTNSWRAFKKSAKELEKTRSLILKEVGKIQAASNNLVLMHERERILSNELCEMLSELAKKQEEKK